MHLHNLAGPRWISHSIGRIYHGHSSTYVTMLDSTRQSYHLRRTSSMLLICDAVRMSQDLLSVQIDDRRIKLSKLFCRARLDANHIHG